MVVNRSFLRVEGGESPRKNGWVGWLRRWWMSLTSSSVIAMVSLYPLSLPEQVREVPFYDKWGHFLMYGMLTLIIFWEHGVKVRLLLLPILLGGLLEVLQATCTTTRSGEWADFLADGVGVGVGALLGWILPHLLEKRRTIR